MCSKAELLDPLTGKSISLTQVIWDTGATGSVLHPKVIAPLGLVRAGFADVQTDRGSSVVETFIVILGMPNRVAIPIEPTVGDYGEGTEMIVGMDVIGHGDFIVQNIDGNTSFSFCLPPFKNKLDMVEKANTINARNAKKRRK